MKKLGFIALLLVGSCASGDFVAPDGRAARLVMCDQPWEDSTACHKKARAFCNGGNYDILRDGPGAMEVACKA